MKTTTIEKSVSKAARDHRLFLKVKIKSLAEEARIIRKEEKRCNSFLKHELRVHRTSVVRLEARATLLAYGYIRGRTYKQLEGKVTPNHYTDKALCTKAKAMVEKYGEVFDPELSYSKMKENHKTLVDGFDPWWAERSK